MSYKVLRNIEFTLDKSSIDNAIREIKQFRRELEEKCMDLVRELAKEGVKIAKMQVVSLEAVDTGDLEKSIESAFFPEERCGIVYANVPYAVYVEYGTGIYGSEDSHPDSGNAGPVVSRGGKNGDETHVHMGYGKTYKADEEGNAISTGHELGWVYRDRNGQFHWTTGYPARPFMYNTLRWLEELAPDKAGEMFSQL